MYVLKKKLIDKRKDKKKKKLNFRLVKPFLGVTIMIIIIIITTTMIIIIINIILLNFFPLLDFMKYPT